MQRVLIALAAVVLLTAAIVLGVKYFTKPGTETAGTPATATTSTGTTTTTPSTPTPGTGAVTATAEPPSPYFAFRRLEIETSSSEPEACLVFTRKLDSSGKVKYEDYLKLDPDTKIAVRATEQRLCIAGLAFGQDYKLEIREGLPAAGGQEKITANETIPVELRDKPSLVRFGKGLVLPRENADGVPITTVNVASLDIKVVRVGDRLLSQLQTGVVDQREFYDYERNTIENEQGEVVWTGKMNVLDNRRNAEATTLFPLRQALKQKQVGPGVFLVVAQDSADKTSTDESYEYKPRAAQFVVDTDLGLTSFTGLDGINIFVRSLRTATPVSGITLALVARNNEELLRVRTDSDGRATFPASIARGTGGMEPVIVMAYGAANDFTFLDLRRPAFDLTDRGVEGRASPGDVDAYMYTDRGVYRPGETVNFTTLVRDQNAKAVSDARLTFVLSRPDGLEAKRFTSNDQEAGGVWTPITLTNTAPRGRWQLAAYVDPKGSPIGRVAFDVQDFVPQKLKVELHPTQQVLKPGMTAVIDVNGRFLYGAPAAGLGGEGTMQIGADRNPFAGNNELKGYHWGKVDETVEGTQVTMNVAETDAQGKTQATAAIDQVADTTLPLKADFTIALYEPGGRTTSRKVTLPLRTRDIMIGVRPSFEWESVQENTPATFEILAVDGNGKPIAKQGLTWELVNENVDYRWYQVDNQWKYERVVNDRIVEGGKVDLNGSEPMKITKSLGWGQYRLTVADPASGATTAYRFWSGWGGGVAGDRPDRVNVTTDKPLYASGDSAKVHINAPTDGKALVVVASNKIHWMRQIDVSASGTDVSVPVSSDWGSGAYAMVTAYKPLSSVQTRAPVRAIGVAWIGVDPAPHTLQVVLHAPQKIAPRQRVTIPVEVKNGGGEQIYLTMAAVDEGILQLTDFVSPDPAKYYLGKRRLGLDMRDDYGRLISADRAVVGQLRSGGDALGGRSLAVVPQKTVSLFSSPVKLDSFGKGDVILDVPDFNGELRLMAVAYSDTRVGHAEQPMTVRDPVVAEIVLPRFLAPGDKVQAALNMHNVEGQPGQYIATVKASGTTASPGGQTRLSVNLGAGERKLMSVPIDGSQLGIGQIALTVTGPGGFKVDRSYPIEVRAPQLPESSSDIALVGANRDNKFGHEVLAGYAPGTTKVAVTVKGSRGFDDVPGLLRWLDRYPYGCIEQTTSRAYPLVFYNDMALLASVKQDKTIKDRVQDATERVLDMQTYGGSFGMWSSISGEADPYIGMFALDFLIQAKAHGYVVPQEGIDRALGWARRATGAEGSGDLARAYGFYLLARSGQVNPSELRYFADTRIEGMTNAFALGLMGTALTDIGDRSRANPAFAKARDIALHANDIKYGHDWYGSLLRDVAGLTAVSAEAQQVALIPALVKRASSFDPRLNYTTTQEKAWMLLAAHAIEASTPPINVAVTGADASGTNTKVLRFNPEAAQVDAGIDVRNNGKHDVWRIVSVEGVPAQPLPASQSGVTLSKAILTMDGKPADLSQVKQNDRFIVAISGEMANTRAHLMALLDLLPAGFEIEGAVQRNDDGSTIYPFLPIQAASNIVEARDDRFITTFDIGSSYQPTDPKEAAKQPKPTFHFAYIVRATIPGSYVVPAAVVEDMYGPDIKARTNMGTMTIAAE
ncbi:MAG: alpha-2-macroglobulin family protein [Alphaproteobacteria bacterium]|nr:alpha-2-macroglobulin family protein [Alphaproteobacteria bacterium]